MELTSIRGIEIDPDERMVEITKYAQKVKESRKAQKISRIKAAAYCGVSELTFKRWEEGCTKRIKMRVFKKLQKIMDGTAEIDG